MAVDVVVRPEGRCIAVICDKGSVLPDRIAVSGAELYGFESGRSFLIGVFTDAMAREAALCSIAVVVVMDGAYVFSSGEVPLSKAA